MESDFFSFLKLHGTEFRLLFSCSQGKIKIASTIPFLIQIKSDWRCAGLFQGTCKTTSITATPTFVKLQHLSEIVVSTSRQLREQNRFAHSGSRRAATLSATQSNPNKLKIFFKLSEGKQFSNLQGFLCVKKKKPHINK